MRDKTGVYREFVDRIFREIDDLETESKKHPLLSVLREYGLTMDEATRLYYKKGMTARQLIEAIRTDRDK
jgi:hypothetical protein